MPLLHKHAHKRACVVIPLATSSRDSSPKTHEFCARARTFLMPSELIIVIISFMSTINTLRELAHITYICYCSRIHKDAILNSMYRVVYTVQTPNSLAYAHVHVHAMRIYAWRVVSSSLGTALAHGATFSKEPQPHCALAGRDREAAEVKCELVQTLSANALSKRSNARVRVRAFTFVRVC